MLAHSTKFFLSFCSSFCLCFVCLCLSVPRVLPSYTSVFIFFLLLFFPVCVVLFVFSFFLLRVDQKMLPLLLWMCKTRAWMIRNRRFLRKWNNEEREWDREESGKRVCIVNVKYHRVHRGCAVGLHYCCCCYFDRRKYLEQRRIKITIFQLTMIQRVRSLVAHSDSRDLPFSFINDALPLLETHARACVYWCTTLICLSNLNFWIVDEHCDFAFQFEIAMDDALRRRQIRDEQFNSFDCWNSGCQPIRSFSQFRWIKSIDSTVHSSDVYFDSQSEAKKDYFDFFFCAWNRFSHGFVYTSAYINIWNCSWNGFSCAISFFLYIYFVCVKCTLVYRVYLFAKRNVYCYPNGW